MGCERSLNKLVLYWLPKRALTALVGRAARLRTSKFVIPWFVNFYRIDLSEAELDLVCYHSLVDFFSRKLKQGARPVSDDGVVAPVDGTVSELGAICNGTLLQAKGSEYTVASLLGSVDAAKRYLGGDYITLYLSPRDYHRIHMPVSGTIVNWRYIPGKLFPVNSSGVRYVPGLFTKNERLITEVDWEAGRIAVVKVGATIVGSVRTPYGPDFSGALSRARKTPCEGKAALRLDKGLEMGHFELGSTVILLFEPNSVESFCVKTGDTVRMGQKIAE